MIDIQYRDSLDPSELHRTQYAAKLIQVTITPNSAATIQPGQPPVNVVVVLANRGRHNCTDDECPK